MNQSSLTFENINGAKCIMKEGKSLDTVLLFEKSDNKILHHEEQKEETSLPSNFKNIIGSFFNLFEQETNIDEMKKISGTIHDILIEIAYLLFGESAQEYDKMWIESQNFLSFLYNLDNPVLYSIYTYPNAFGCYKNNKPIEIKFPSLSFPLKLSEMEIVCNRLNKLNPLYSQILHGGKKFFCVWCYFPYMCLGNEDLSHCSESLRRIINKRYSESSDVTHFFRQSYKDFLNVKKEEIVECNTNVSQPIQKINFENPILIRSKLFSNINTYLKGNAKKTEAAIHNFIQFGIEKNSKLFKFEGSNFIGTDDSPNYTDPISCALHNMICDDLDKGEVNENYVNDLSSKINEEIQILFPHRSADDHKTVYCIRNAIEIVLKKAVCIRLYQKVENVDQFLNHSSSNYFILLLNLFHKLGNFKDGVDDKILKLVLNIDEDVVPALIKSLLNKSKLEKAECYDILCSDVQSSFLDTLETLGLDQKVFWKNALD